jgi:exopolysaccharide biosynthesis polyprenyl glycosylphosphotransferase
MNKKIQAAKYFTFDLLGSAIAWFLFHTFRKQVIETELYGSFVPFEVDMNVIIGHIFLPLFWVFLFFISGFYRDVYRRSRLKELGLSIGITLIGTLVIFFLLLLDDYVANYRNYYQLFSRLLILQFSLTYLPRLFITSTTISKIRSRKIFFPTIIVGDGQSALEVFDDITNEIKSQGNRIVGFVSTNEKINPLLANKSTNLGQFKQLKNIIRNNNIEEVILAVDTNEKKNLSIIVNELLGLNIIVKAIPSMYDYLTGRVKMSSIFGTPLIQISFDLMPIWQQKFKKLLDLFTALFALILLSPVIIIIALLVKFSSKGPVFFAQERVGQYGKPFNIYKFRSMYADAEASGPALSSKLDNRITPIGKFLRKTRLDELPNFWNVLKGDLSLVGPRPERQFYIDQIIVKAPHYIHLQKVKPGITSWGQVKYGYAENVDQMIERLKYDLLYIENMSLYVDFKILIYTLITVFRGRGI